MSSQMAEEGGLLHARFKSSLLGKTKTRVNSCPANLRSISYKSAPKVYPFLDGKAYRASSFESFLDYNEKAYKILVIGPTGAVRVFFLFFIFFLNYCMRLYIFIYLIYLYLSCVYTCLSI